MTNAPGSFRPLIRGLSISSTLTALATSMTWSFRPLIRGLSISSLLTQSETYTTGVFPSPHPGIINFFHMFSIFSLTITVSVPSSGDYQFLLDWMNRGVPTRWVSVPSSGDYQFLLIR